VSTIVKYAHTRANRDLADVSLGPIQALVLAPFMGEMSLSNEDTAPTESPSLERDGDKSPFSPSPGGSYDQHVLV
jgi:hypothetical protein